MEKGCHQFATKKTYLNNSLLSFDLKDLTLPDATVSEPNIYNLCVFWELDVVKNDKRSLYVKDGSVIDSRCDVVICGDSFEMLLQLSFIHLIDRHFLFLILCLIKTTLFFML